VRVENALWEIAGIPDIRAVGAYIEDLDVAAFAAAATALHANGKHLIVLKGGVSEAGSRATAAHSRALASHGPALRQLLADSGTIVVDDADELLAALALCEPFARGRVPRLGLVSLSGGLGAVATDCARSLGLPLAPPSSETEQALRDLGMPALTNPLDLEAAPSSSEQKVAAVQALLDDTNLDGVFLLVNDMPGLGGFLDDLSPLAAAAGDPLIVCSACSHQSDDLWRAWTARGHRYFDGSSTTLRALAAFHRRLDRQSEATPEQRGQLPFPAVREALVAASIPFAEAEEVHTVAEAVQVANRLGYPVVLKVARAGHRGQAGVRTLLDSAVAVERAWDELTGRAPLLLQRQAQPGLEFYVGVMNDPTFGRLLLLGRGGRQVENWQDVAVARLPADRDTITRLLDRTVAGGWLRQPASRGIADLAALVDVAERAAGMAADLGARLQSLDLNPVVVHRSGATVVDAKVVLRCEP
jgi:acyl-CoA synthetase (NDP forming)